MPLTLIHRNQTPLVSLGCGGAIFRDRLTIAQGGLRRSDRKLQTVAEKQA